MAWQCSPHHFWNCTGQFLTLGTAEGIESHKMQALMKKIKDRFGERISVSSYDHCKGNFVYRSSMSEGDARVSLDNDTEKHIHAIRTAALHLRAVIQSVPKWETPTPTSIAALKACSPELPEELLFHRTLLCGLRVPSGDDDRDAVDRKVAAMSQMQCTTPQEVQYGHGKTQCLDSELRL